MAFSTQEELLERVIAIGGVELRNDVEDALMTYYGLGEEQTIAGFLEGAVVEGALRSRDGRSIGPRLEITLRRSSEVTA
jgi:hypothetical protein